MTVKPQWLRVKAPQWERVGNVKEILRDLSLNTVCEEASCPNIGECFNAGTATFLIMGPACTRACPYCDIDFEKKPQPLDPTETPKIGASGAAAQTQPRRDYLCQPGRFAGWGRVSVCRVHSSSAIGDARYNYRSFDSRLVWQLAGFRNHSRSPARGTQPQYRNRKATLPQGAAARKVRSHLGTIAAKSRTRTWGLHQIRHHGGTGRNRHRNSRGDAGLTGCRLRYFNSWTVPATDSKALERRKLCASGTV